MKSLFILIFCLLAVVNLFAQSRTKEIGFQSENDGFLAQGSDRYYTNGFFIYYRKALDAGNNGNLANKVLGFELAQKIFNPRSGFIPDARYDDRPFAGYLYIGPSLNLLFKNESNLKLTARLGVVGPAAGGEPVQNFIHKTFGFYKPNGWQYQVRNDVELNLSAEYNKLLARASWVDVSLASYGNLGTGFISTGAGPMVRLGNFNQLFQSVSTQSTASRQDISLLHQQEIFFYYKPQANIIGYDATVQGSIFKDHPEPNTLEITRNIKNFVFSNQLGVNYATGRFVYDLSAVFNTKSVEGVKKAHQWGSLTVLYRFN